MSTFRRQELLKVGLESLNKQKIPWEYEIVVVNDGTEDGTKEVCLKYPQVKYVVLRPGTKDSNLVWRCPSLALNVGVKQSEGDVLIFTCPEIYHPYPDNIFNLVSPILENNSLMTYTEGYDDRGGKILKAIKEGNPITTLTPTKENFLKELHTQYPFCMGFSREKYFDIGGYDEDFMAGYAYDDTDFVNRMLKNGVNYLKVPGLIIHLYHTRARFNLPETKILFEKNKALYTQKLNVIKRNVGVEWGVIK